MKKILLTFVALLAFTASVSAQNFTAQRESRSYVKNYSWGKGGQAKASIGYDKGLVGDITITVRSDKGVDVKNNTGLYLKIKFEVGAYVSHNNSNINNPDESDVFDEYTSAMIPPHGTWKSTWKFNEAAGIKAIMPSNIRVVSGKRP